MARRRAGIAADYLGGDPALAAPLRGRLRLDVADGLRFAGRDGAGLSAEPERLEAAGVVERPAGEDVPMARRLRMMADAGDWDTGRLHVRLRRDGHPVILEFLVVSVDAATLVSRYNADRERRGLPGLRGLGPEDEGSAPLAAAEEAEDG